MKLRCIDDTNAELTLDKVYVVIDGTPIYEGGHVVVTNDAGQDFAYRFARFEKPQSPLCE